MQQSIDDCAEVPWPQQSALQRYLEDVVVFYGMHVTRRTAIAICSETERSWPKLQCLARAPAVDYLDPADVLTLQQAYERYENPIRGETDFHSAFCPGREI